MAPTVSELRDEVKAMEDSWQKMYDDEEDCGNGKAMLLLALRIRQCCQKLKVYFATHLQPEQLSAHMKVVDWKVFNSHAMCARDCLNAGAYHDTLMHARKAHELNHAHGCAWEEAAVINVLYLEMEAWKGLGERTKSLAIAERRAQAMAMLSNVQGDEQVAALLEVATVQIEQKNYQAAEKTAREALVIECPPASRNVARVKLGIALLGIGDGDEALRELERCEREWSMSGEGTFWSTDALKRDKAILDKTLKRLRECQAAHPKSFPPKQKFLLSEKYTEMRQTWDRMAKQDPLDPKALLALALRLRQRAVDEINKCIAKPTSDEISEILRDIDNRIFEMHTCCAAECLKAEEYQATLEHTKSAIKLNETWDRMWQESVVMYVLDSEKEAWLRLGDFSMYLDVAKHRARAMAEYGRTGYERAQAFCEIVAVQLEINDYVDAVATSREAIAVDAPRVGGLYARLTLGTALMAAGHIREAVREFERCESEWTTSIDGTEMSEAELARMRRSLDNNLRSCRRRLAEKQLAETLREDEQLLHPSMNHVMKGDFDKSAESAERTASLLLSGMCNSPGLARFKTSNLPSCQARAFTLTNCFLLDDHRAAGWLGAVQQAVELCEREPLEDACPICLQQLAWPAELEVGTRVTVHGLKKATHRNGDQGVVERLSVGPDHRVQVRFCKNAEPEEGVLTIEEHKAVLRGLLEQVDKPCPSAYSEEVRRAAEASLSAGIGCLESKQDAVDEVLKDMLIGDKCEISTLEDIISLAQATSFPDLRRSITNEIARLEASAAYSLRVRPANLKASKGYIDASRRAFMTNCLHCFHARCIKRFVDETFHEGQQICPVCGEELEFAETLVMCAQMPSWDRPSYVD